MSTRRDFIKKTVLSGVALGALGLPGYAGNSSETAKKGLKIPRRKGKSVMGLRCEPLPVVRIAVIGLGRGNSAVYRLARIKGTQIVAIDDLVPERIASAQENLRDAGRPEAIVYSKEEDWKKICERDDIDLIYNATPWNLHVPIALYAMKHGKHVTIEVPAAMTIDDCWALVDMAEQAQRHCMMLENCCYDFFELTTLNMARKGLFGEVFHGECAYIHDLRCQLDRSDSYHNTWRVDHYTRHTGNPYPTHGLGPIAQMMGINRGDRFDYLTSMSSNHHGLTLYAENKYGKDSSEAKTVYKLGDMNCTTVKTVNGNTILIEHNVTSPAPYDRLHKLYGTKGYAVKYPEQKIALEPDPHEFLSDEDFNAIMKKYEHPLSRYIGEQAKKVGGHGGMDYIMDWRLIYCLRNGLPLDQDVYDAAAWSSIVELSERSVLDRSNSVEVPDFTRGEWKDAKPWPIIDMDRVL
ncbi:Gfo/Idh/MocA family oxidoreductase [Petrimonas sulfuriphila]|jgi:predicted dehydrogenase|uniref:Gfo/Idh/MocA family protein n=1 Tax=Dysgonomonadaceae TaxID=2005520 RepID=UPI0025802E6E|nr:MULTISPECIES: Gfo/Idh/MocA family oxidoreductase [unclassified Proteiniphilum]